MKYATKAAFKRAVDLAKEHDIRIGGFELLPGGAIRIMTAADISAAEPTESLYDQLKREGKL